MTRPCAPPRSPEAVDSVTHASDHATGFDRMCATAWCRKIAPRETTASNVRVARLVPIALLVLANALWGSSYVVAKTALGEIPPPLLAALRFTIAVVVLWVVIGIRRRMYRDVRVPSGSDALRLLGLGVLGVAINALLGYWGISLTTATDA